MEVVDKKYYSYVKPKGDEYGISFIYNIRLEHLSVELQKELIAEIKAFKMPAWLDLLASDDVFQLFFGKEKIHGQKLFAADDEVYLAILPGEKVDYCTENEKVLKVQSSEEFAVWARTANNILSGGRPDMHPIYHYPLCQKGFMQCYILYNSNIPVSVAAIMDNNGVASLELVATIPEMRRQGFARPFANEQSVMHLLMVPK